MAEDLSTQRHKICLSKGRAKEVTGEGTFVAQRTDERIGDARGGGTLGRNLCYP